MAAIALWVNCSYDRYCIINTLLIWPPCIMSTLLIWPPLHYEYIAHINAIVLWVHCSYDRYCNMKNLYVGDEFNVRTALCHYSMLIVSTNRNTCTKINVGLYGREWQHRFVPALWFADKCWLKFDPLIWVTCHIEAQWKLCNKCSGGTVPDRSGGNQSKWTKESVRRANSNKN